MCSRCQLDRAMYFGGMGLAWDIPRADLCPFKRIGGYSGAEIITNTVLGLPYYNYSTMGPKAVILMIKALTLCGI